MEPRGAEETTVDIDTMLAGAKLPEEIVPLCLRPDLRDRWQDLNNQLMTTRTGRNTMAPTTGEKELAQKIKALEAEIAENTMTVLMRGLRHEPWAKLVAEHPPRMDKPGDQQSGFNVDTFIPALVRAQIVEPELSEAQFDKLVDVITQAQWDDLANAAYSLGRGDRNRPVFSQAASQLIPDSGDTSRQQPGSGSPRRASKAKSPKS
ncbi:hypothetical protein [Amycolatopsis sp. NPDC001319]|uniref:hypothetical protein n=1 Tax=unclassified Amycolatopsis TaxID=2618356 RepID=UPI0036CF06A1